MKIIPAILTNDIGELTFLLEKAEKAVDRVQIDVIDGKFADNHTVDPNILKNIATNLNLDYHLMVDNPHDWIDRCVLKEKTRIIGQIEKMPNQQSFIDTVISAGCMVGLGIDIETPVYELEEKVMKSIDTILIMSVKAGWDHEEFDLRAWDKIKATVELRQKLNLDFKISVDGGVTKELVRQMADLGVDEVFVGRRIFDPDLEENLKLFSNGQN